MKLEAYVSKWHLTDLVQIAVTLTSTVYRAKRGRNDVVLKIFTHAKLEREARAASTLEYFGADGCVKLIEVGAAAHLLEFVSGRDLKSVSKAGSDEDATLIACDVIKRLHKPRNRLRPEVISMWENFRMLFSEAAELANEPIFFEARTVAARLLEDGETNATVLHGDLHHLNILESSDRGWIAIDPHGVFGDRAYDCANLFFNPDDAPSLTDSETRISKMATAFSDNLKIDRLKILEFAFAHGALSSAWCLEHAKDSSRRLRIARLIQNVIASGN